MLLKFVRFWCHDDVEASDGEQSGDNGAVDVLENLFEAASDSECEDSADIEVNL